MTETITLYDETLAGERTPALRLSLLSSRITLRELLRRRIYEEVQEFNAAPPETQFRGLVTPTNLEHALNGDPKKPRPKQRVDWEAQYARALEAFARNGFFVLVGDRQVDDLDAEIESKLETDVTFFKLVPLVGG